MAAVELESSWTVNEQRCLDQSIASNPKVDGEDSKVRWQRIAGKVPGRSLKECVLRYREIREKLQQRAVISHPTANIIPPKQNSGKNNQGISVGYSPPAPPPVPPIYNQVQSQSIEQKSSKATTMENNNKKKQGKSSRPQAHVIENISSNSNISSSSNSSSSSNNRSGGGFGCGGGGGGGDERKNMGSVLIDDDFGEEVFSSNRGLLEKKSHGWWKKLEEDDPISLEPLKELSYPPFELSFQTSGLIKPAVNYFDGKVLAYYIVSTLNFTNPLSRDPLSRDDCRKLDEYLSRYKLEAVLVSEAFDLFQAQKKQGSSMGSSGREVQLQREATKLFRLLFSFSSNSHMEEERTPTTAASMDVITTSNNSNTNMNRQQHARSHEQQGVIEVERVMSAAKGLAGNVLSVDDITLNNPKYASLYGNIYKSDGDEVDLSLYNELFPSLPTKNKNRNRKKKNNGGGGSEKKSQVIGFLGAGKQTGQIEKQISQAKNRSSKRNGELQGQKRAGTREGNSSFANAVTNKNLNGGNMSEALRIRMEEALEKKSKSKNGQTKSWAGKV